MVPPVALTVMATHARAHAQVQVQAQAPTAECNLSHPTIFHDVGVPFPNGTLNNPFGVYSVVRRDDGDYSMTSLNETWSGALDAKYNASKTMAEMPLTVTFPASMGGKASGTAGGEPSCEEFAWWTHKGGMYVQAAVWRLGVLPPPVAPCHFAKEIWHTFISHASGLEFELNSLNTTHFSIHALNKTFEDTVATILSPLHGQVRTVSAAFSDSTPKGAVQHGVVDGSECTFIRWGTDPSSTFWERGPLPPPPPPPPAQCETSFNKTVCDAVKPPSGNPKDSCEWCTSSDGAHGLCFHANHLPTGKGWTCTKK